MKCRACNYKGEVENNYNKEGFREISIKFETAYEKDECDKTISYGGKNIGLYICPICGTVRAE